MNILKLSEVKNYISMKEAIALLGVPASTIRSWEKRGLIQAYRHPMSKFRMFKKEELEYLLNNRNHDGI